MGNKFSSRNNYQKVYNVVEGRVREYSALSLHQDGIVCWILYPQTLRLKNTHTGKMADIVITKSDDYNITYKGVFSFLIYDTHVMLTISTSSDLTVNEDLSNFTASVEICEGNGIIYDDPILYSVSDILPSVK